MDESGQQLWMVLPLILRTLGEEDAEELLQRAQDTFARDSTLIDRMVSVSARLDLIDRLREERTVSGQEVYAERRWRDIDQLTMFLAATCIPIEQESFEERSQAPYQSFVAGLPEWAQEWLGATYLLLPAEANPETSVREWLAKEAAAKCSLVAAHLAVAARVYPQVVDYTPWDEHDRLHASQAIRNARFEFLWLHPADQPSMSVGTAVGIRAGIPESEAIRFLLVVALRARLEVEDDSSFIDRYWARRRVQVWGLRAIRELEDNVTHIHAWSARDLYTRPSKADYAPIAGLPDQAVRALLEDPDNLQQYGGVPVEELEAYLQGLANINAQVAALNQRADHPEFDLQGKADAETALFTAILSDPDTRALVERIQSIHVHLSRHVMSGLS